MVKQSKQMVKQSPKNEDERNDNLSSVKYRGVRKRKWGKFVSEIRLPNSRERIWLGSYDTAEKAAFAFDAALFCLRGHSAKFNFPNNPPHIRNGRSLSPSEIQTAAAEFAESCTIDISDSHRFDETVISDSGSPTLKYETTSPSSSEWSTDQLVRDSNELAMDTSFLDQMLDLGSGNGPDYGLFPNFDEFEYAFLEQSFLPLDSSSVDYVSEDYDEISESSENSSFLWSF